MESPEKYMRRAVELALRGMGLTSPNPMVGAVIVAPDGRVIGEGWHRKYGSAHAEVNAVNSVREADRDLLTQSTLYVTLEPCSHYGKTPPCAKMIIEKGIRHVVVGVLDPFESVSGRGIEMLRKAGVKVDVGLLAKECEAVCEKFIAAHRRRLPFVTLKWAQSADGFIDDNVPGHPHKFSDLLNTTLVHRLRSLHDMILIGSQTALNDNPMLNCRLWAGRSPRPVIVDRRKRVDVSMLRADDPLIIYDCEDVESVLGKLYESGATSVLVEGGAKMLKAFIDAGLWDEARVETTFDRLGINGGVEAPHIDNSYLRKEVRIGGNSVRWYENLNMKSRTKNVL